MNSLDRQEAISTSHCNNIEGPNRETVTMSSFKVVGGTTYRTFRIIWMMEELGIPYEHVVAHPRSKLARQHHPLGKVPVLIHKHKDKTTTTLWESGAILTYLGDVHQRLIPTTLPRPLYDQTMHTLLSEADAQALWIYRKHESLSHVFGKATPEVLEEAQRTYTSTNQLLVKQLSPYLLGSDFTICDIVYVHLLDWTQNIGWDPFDNVVQDDELLLSRYLDLCRSRPAYKRTVEKRNAEIEKLKQKNKANENNKASNL